MTDLLRKWTEDFSLFLLVHLFQPRKHNARIVSDVSAM